MGGHGEVIFGQTGIMRCAVRRPRAERRRAASRRCGAAASRSGLTRDLAARQLVVAEDQRMAGAAGVGALNCAFMLPQPSAPAACICTRQPAARSVSQAAIAAGSACGPGTTA